MRSGAFDAGDIEAAPAVIGPEHVADETEQPDGPVFVPCQQPTPGAESVDVELRNTEDGQLALLVYSDQDTLVRCCGEDQPWIAVPANELDRLTAQTGADLVLHDVEFAEQEEDQ